MKEYLKWFEENLKMIREATSPIGGVDFQLHLGWHGWEAGFVYFEDYDGTYFLRCISGKGETPEEALKVAVEKSRPVVKLIAELNEEFIRQTSFALGRQYMRIGLDRDGLATLIKVTKVQNQRGDRDRLRFQDDDTGSVLLFPAEGYGLIYDASPELEKLVECGCDKPT